MKQTYSLCFLFGSLLFFAGCGSPGEMATDTDEPVADNEESDEMLSDSDANYYNDDGFLVRPCIPACGSNEVCNPYGECICDSRKSFIGSYRGTCITGPEANKLFCNNHSWTYNVRPSASKGASVVLENDTDLLCTECLPGWSGEQCGTPLTPYGDLLPDGSAEGTVFFFQPPAPYCTKNDECTDGLVCGENGYCQCTGAISFADAAFEKEIRDMLDLDESAPVTGEMLSEIIQFHAQDVSVLDDLRCLPNLRELFIRAFVTAPVSLEPVSSLRFLQRISILGYVPLDLSPLKELDRLLVASFYILPENDIEFLNGMKSKDSITRFSMVYNDDITMVDLSFLEQYTNITSLSISLPGRNEDTQVAALAVLPHPEKLEFLYFMGWHWHIDDPSVFGKMNRLKDLTLFEPGSNVHLSDFPANDRLLGLYMEGEMIDIPIRDVFPTVVGLKIRNEINDIEPKVAGLDLLSFIYTSEFDEKALFKEDTYNNMLTDWDSLIEVYINPYYASNIDWLEGKKYISTVNIQPWEDDADFIPTEEYWRKSVIVPELLYLHMYVDNMRSLHSFDEFVANCRNGGTLCRKDCEGYVINYSQYLVGGAPKLIYLYNNPIDPVKDAENIEFLSQYGITVGYDGDSEEGKAKNLFPYGANRNFLFDEREGAYRGRLFAPVSEQF